MAVHTEMMACWGTMATLGSQVVIVLNVFDTMYLISYKPLVPKVS